MCVLLAAIVGVRAVIPYPGENAEIEDCVRYYFQLCYNKFEILGFLLTVHHVSVSLRTIQRILTRLGLRRRQCESSFRVIVSCIYKLHRLGYGKYGYSSLWKVLNTRYGVQVTQKTTRLLVREIDPEGVRLRSIHRLRRRTYYNRGPNYLVHIDGYDKLLPFGFPIHGAIDGYSRKILWLRILPSSKNPRFVARLYFDFISKIGKVPRMIRADAGKENTLVRDIHTLLRFRHNDDVCGYRSFTTGRSVANQRIESFWCFLMRNFTQYWRNLFKDLIDMNIFDNTNPTHLQCIRVCFFQLIQDHLDQFCLYWNSHRIRSQRGLDVPCGIPDVLYFQSTLFDRIDYGFQPPCTGADINRLANEFSSTIPYFCCEEDFLERLIDLTESDPADLPVPKNQTEALTLFRALTTAMHP